MSTWQPPRPTYHLRVFALSLALIFVCLAGFLFGVRLEAVAPATGVVTARELEEVRALLPGLAEPGWYEGELRHAAGPLRVRLDVRGHGLTDPAQGPPRAVQHFQLAGGAERVGREELRFHRLEAGDELWPGQVVAVVRPAAANGKKEPPDPSAGAAPASALLPEDAVLRVPETHVRWQVVDVRAARFQAVQAGDLLARVVPLDPDTGRPRDLLARLDLDEKHCGDLAPGQTVRLFSAMYNARLHGHAEAVLERLEPWGEAGPAGERRFRAVARITHAPFHLPLGSSFRAEVVVGRKAVYRIILEQ